MFNIMTIVEQVSKDALVSQKKRIKKMKDLLHIQ